MGKAAFEKGTVVERAKDIYKKSIKFLDAYSLKHMLGKIAEAKTTQMKVFLGFFFAVLVYLLLIAVPAYSVVLGAIEVTRCVQHELMSIWLIVIGSTILFYFVVSFVGIGLLAIKFEFIVIYQRLLDILVYLFVLVWMCLGKFWLCIT